MSNLETDAPAATADDDPVHNPTTNTPADHDDAPDKDAELARWKAQSRENERRAKANAAAAKELEQLKAASMTELEKAVNEAKSATRAEVLREVGATRVDDIVRLAAAGRPADVDALLEGLDRNRFLDDDGQPDSKAIKAWIDRVAPPAKDEPATATRVPTGARGSGTPKADPAAEFAQLINGQLKPS